jgi:hypothetical protein
VSSDARSRQIRARLAEIIADDGKPSAAGLIRRIAVELQADYSRFVLSVRSGAPDVALVPRMTAGYAALRALHALESLVPVTAAAVAAAVAEAGDMGLCGESGAGYLLDARGEVILLAEELAAAEAAVTEPESAAASELEPAPLSSDVGRALTRATAIIAERDAEVARLSQRLDLAASALAGDHEGIRLWMLDCTAQAERHRERADAAVARASDYENRITWDTNCGEHARLLDSCRAAEERAERAEAQLARAGAAVPDDMILAHRGDILTLTGIASAWMPAAGMALTAFAESLADWAEASGRLRAAAGEAGTGE